MNTFTLLDNGTEVVFDNKTCKCSCPKGNEGKKCRHSLFLSSRNHHIQNENNSHLLSTKKRLFYISTGKDLENPEKYRTLHSSQIDQADPETELHDSAAMQSYSDQSELSGGPCSPPPFKIDAANDNNEEFEDDTEYEESKMNLIQRFNSMNQQLLEKLDDKELFSAVKNYTTFIEKNLKKKVGMAKIINSLKNIESKPIRKKIRVQTASIQRRVCGRTTTSSITAGRYCSNSFLRARCVAKQKARKHCLRDAIKNNYQNGGKF